MAGARVIHGSLAAAAAVLATAASTLDIPEKLHLRATPIVFYSMPMPMPEPLTKSGNPWRDSSFPYVSSSFSLAQGAPAISASSRRALSHFFPVYLATSVSSPRIAPSSQFAKYSAYSSHLSQAQSRKYSEFLHSQVPYVESSPVVKTFAQPSQSLHTWHVPSCEDGAQESKEPVVTVVLLGWLGAQQKHLKKYADWYNARGINAVTFVIPMADILSFKVEKKAEEQVDSLAGNLIQWLREEGEHGGDKQLVFHTFSNTGWLTYGVVLEKMQEEGEDIVGRIKGCVIDSAPFPDPDPQVWAAGFSAALLKKRSSASKPELLQSEMKEGVTAEAASEGAVTMGGGNGFENAVLSVLEKFFSIFLKMPAINQRLSEVVTVLQKKQPPCPQLYIYSTADKVIPVKAVEAFIEEQRLTGRVVRSCNLQNSPHVDHFRSYPHLYSEQLSNFLKEVTLASPHGHADAL